MEVNKKICLKCQKEKFTKRDFYVSNSSNHADGRYPICKPCIRENIELIYEPNNPMSKDAIETVKNVLLEMNRPFMYSQWLASVEESNKTGKELFGMYLKNIQLNFKDYTWKDSEFGSINDIGSKSSDVVQENQHNIVEQNISISSDELEHLKEIYGHGYPDEEYVLFEKKFRKLKPSFQLPTTMHEEYLREYCVNKVKETIAKAKGEFKEAKEWAAMAKESAEAGKLKPSQMSKADLSKGLDGFGQLSRMVEQHRDIIPLLPKFTQQPKDKVDVTLWLYINYIRDLQGLPEAEYQDIYGFYEDRRKDYESQELDSSPDMQVVEEDE